MTQHVIDSTDVTPNGMEEVIGSIPIRSTTLTPADSKSYSNRSGEQLQKQGHN
jgi:hypothetical protein